MPLHLIPPNTNLDFMGKRWLGFIFSGLLTLVSFGLIAYHGLNLGIDFTGGIVMEIRTETAPDLGKLRTTLVDPAFGEVSLQTFGEPNDVMIRLQTSREGEQAALVARVKELLGTVVPGQIDYRKIDYVGPTVGEELIEKGILAVVLSFGAIIAYVWMRFEWQYSLGAILALLHDSVMMIGFFAVTRFEFGLTALAAVLTIIGYSINDSVVIYDRIRENMRKFKKMPLEELLNRSINDTLSRTILTASTTLLAALALALFGGEVLRGFSWSLVWGVVIGTYSSIYISAPTLIYMRLREDVEAAPVAA